MATAAPEPAKAGEQPPAQLMGGLEEDDEFEEFETEEWSAQEEAPEDTQLWEDEWDDADVGDDFTQQLRAELAKAGNPATQPPPQQA